MGFAQQHSIIHLLRNGEFRRTETFSTHEDQILESVLPGKDKRILKKAKLFNSSPLNEKLYSRNMKTSLSNFQKVPLFKTALIMS